MWDSVPKYRLYCVIKGNVSYPNRERELAFNIKEGKQTPQHSENPHHAGADSMQVWMGAGAVGGDGERGARRRKGGVWRTSTTGTVPHVPPLTKQDSNTEHRNLLCLPPHPSALLEQLQKAVRVLWAAFLPYLQYLEGYIWQLTFFFLLFFLCFCFFSLGLKKLSVRHRAAITWICNSTPFGISYLRVLPQCCKSSFIYLHMAFP